MPPAARGGAARLLGARRAGPQSESMQRCYWVVTDMRIACTWTSGEMPHLAGEHECRAAVTDYTASAPAAGGPGRPRGQPSTAYGLRRHGGVVRAP